MSSGRTIMVEGRIVFVVGDLFKGQPKLDFNTRAPKLDQLGQQQTEFGFGLAVPKTNAAEIWNAIHEEAFTMYPSRQIPPSFSMKYKDGDSAIDDKGVSYSQRKGYPGCLVFTCKTSLAIKFFRHENGSNIMVNDGIKCGDFVRVQLSVKAHGSVGQNGKPGLYLNPLAVLFLGYGEPIVNAPSGDQIFGSQAPSLPPGASATPIGPAGGLLVPQNFGQQAPPMMQQPVMQPQAPQVPAWGGQPQAQPQPSVPHYGILPQQYQQAPPQMQPPQGMPQPQGMPGLPQMPQ